jgi:TPR repeat protein
MYTYLEKLGNSLGMCNVGTCYENGVGVAKDMNLAKEWYSKAAAQGYDRAQVALGNLSNTA